MDRETRPCQEAGGGLESHRARIYGRQHPHRVGCLDPRQTEGASLCGGAGRERGLQAADQAEGHGGGGERLGPESEGLRARPGGDAVQDCGRGPCVFHQLWQAGTRRGTHQHRQHLPAGLLAA